jgi:hypothetical protein
VLPLLVVIYPALHFAYFFRWFLLKPVLPAILGTVRIGKPNVRVFDLSLYNGEAFYLLIRLRTLSQVMTRFLISYANCTFSGRHNHPVTFAPYESQIAQFGDLLRRVRLDVCGVTRSWNREKTARQTLITAVLSENARSDDLVILSDVDEYIDPVVLSLLIKQPPLICYRLTYHAYYYSLRWQFYRNWTRPMIFRVSALSNTAMLSRRYPIYPVIAGIHYSYCFNIVTAIIHRLQTFSHTEYSHRHWINPVFIVSKVARGIILFNANRNAISLAPPNPRGLDLPPDMGWFLWGMPFKYLPGLRLNPHAVCERAQFTLISQL